jgi:hypothetical protein
MFANALCMVRMQIGYAIYTLLPALRILKINYEDKRNIFRGLLRVNA